MERNYEFSDLLHVFFALRIDPDSIKTYRDLAKACGVDRRTVTNWFNGNTKPSSAQQIERIISALGILGEHADMLLYSVNPAWVRFGTPTTRLDVLQLFRPWEVDVAYPVAELLVPPTPPEIEQSWQIYFEERFETNFHRWGTGVKDDGVGRIERSIRNQMLHLTMTSFYPVAVFLGADSDCFAPIEYYLSVEAKIMAGDTSNSGYVVIFEELSDNRHAIFRIREPTKQASVVQTNHGKTDFNIYLNRVAAESIVPNNWNKLAILAINTQHWFYINNRLIGRCSIPRHAMARLDLGIVVEQPTTSPANVVAAVFRNFVVRTPPTT